MLSNTIKHLPKTHKLILGTAAFCLCVVLLFPSSSTEAKKVEVVELTPGVEYPLTLPEFSDTQIPPDLFEAEDNISYKVKRGDTLAKIFSDHGLSAQTTFKVSRAGEEAKRLKSIKPGQHLYLKINEAGQLESLKYPLSNTNTLHIAANEDGFRSYIDEKKVETVIRFAQGTINSSFWNAGLNAGLTDNQIMQLAGIFGWDIDFAQEIRAGDAFNMAYESLYVDGEFVGFGDVVAAEFVNQGDTFTAIRYTDGNYYTPDGRSMRKSFLRAPINFRYVSSNFNPRRFHPVQKRIKPHNGVDYAAPIGTPVVAAGKGRVIEAGYNRYNGNYVFVQHGERYVTKYLHLKRKKVKTGQQVKQGQTIGTLGRTGMVTGAHLHYEFLVDGVHRNPRTVTLPKADPIDPKEKANFLVIAKNTTALLENNKRIMLAMR